MNPTLELVRFFKDENLDHWTYYLNWDCKFLVCFIFLFGISASRQSIDASHMSAVAKSIKKFEAYIREGEAAYEAQQFIKTVYYRSRSRKAYEESRDLLEQAACIQYERNEVISSHSDRSR